MRSKDVMTCCSAIGLEGVRTANSSDALFKREPAQRASMDRPPKPFSGRPSLSGDSRGGGGAEAKCSDDFGRRGARRSLEVCLAPDAEPFTSSKCVPSRRCARE